MQKIIKQLIQLQQIDTRILEKRRLIDKMPLRISEVDSSRETVKAELEKLKQKAELASKKKKEREKALEDVRIRISKMKVRTQDIKTNKEYQAHLKEIESSEKEISSIEDQILHLMGEADASLLEQQDMEKSVQKEIERTGALRKELETEATELQEDIALLKQERQAVAAPLDAGIYNLYLGLLKTCNGLALAKAQDEICLGCDMNIPPRFIVEIIKGTELVQCPQCYRILYLEEIPG